MVLVLVLVMMVAVLMVMVLVAVVAVLVAVVMLLVAVVMVLVAVVMVLVAVVMVLVAVVMVLVAVVMELVTVVMVLVAVVMVLVVIVIIITGMLVLVVVVVVVVVLLECHQSMVPSSTVSREKEYIVLVSLVLVLVVIGSVHSVPLFVYGDLFICCSTVITRDICQCMMFSSFSIVCIVIVLCFQVHHYHLLAPTASGHVCILSLSKYNGHCFAHVIGEDKIAKLQRLGVIDLLAPNYMSIPVDVIHSPYRNSQYRSVLFHMMCSVYLICFIQLLYVLQPVMYRCSAFVHYEVCHVLLHHALPHSYSLFCLWVLFR